ncbi:MAG: hypothetical protein U0Y68_02605 [Blastocatellia bacterium]
MKILRQCLFAFALASATFSGVISASAQSGSNARRENPYTQISRALEAIENLRVEDVRKEIEKGVGNLRQQNPGTYLKLAELMKRVGDARAEDYYERAIQADDTEPAYELFYADYLRNFRGPQRPLFPRAEQHYFRALEKLRQLPQKASWDDVTERRVERGLVALYQEDGVAWLYRKAEGTPDLPRPVAFFSTNNRAAQLAGDFNNLDEARAYTSEALFVESRTGHSLTDAQLAGLIRRKDQFETTDRLRFRNRGWPVIDVLYKFRTVGDAKIPRFDQPNRFTDVDLKEYGLAIEKPFSVAKNLDLYVRGAYKRASRRGLIDFQPRSKEAINQFEAKGALSRFFGPDKVIVEGAYVFQNINLQILTPYKRERKIGSVTLTYQRLRSAFRSVYRNRFETRGWHFFGGFANDQDVFGAATITKNDFFVGTSLRGMGRFDLTLQPTFFTASVAGDGPSRRENSQYRTNANLLFRLRDEERAPEVPRTKTWLHPAFVHLVIPFRHDLALNGLSKFENYKVGVELYTKLYSTSGGRTTILVSCGYNYQRFYQLNRTLNLFNVSLSIGY